MPILGPDSILAAKAAHFAREKNKFAEVNNKLLQERTLTRDRVSGVLKECGFTASDIDALLADSGIDQLIKDNYQQAQNLGVQGTPVLILSNAKQTEVGFINDYADQESLEKLLRTQPR